MRISQTVIAQWRLSIWLRLAAAMLIMASAILPATSRAAQTNLSPTTLLVCNESGQDYIDVAWAYWEQPGFANPSNWRSEGWRTIPNGKCERIDLKNYDDGDAYEGMVYVHSSNQKTVWAKDDVGFCVYKGKAFQLRAADVIDCDKKNQTVVRASKIDVIPGAVNRIDLE